MGAVEDVRWLGPREERAWRGLMSMQADISQHIERNLRARNGLSTADYEVLALLSEAPDGQLRAFRIGEALRWEKGRLSQHLSRMEGRGLVVRERCLPGQRGVNAVITASGREAVDAAAGAHVADARAVLLDHLTPEQLDLITELADLVRTRVETLAAQSPPGSDT